MLGAGFSFSLFEPSEFTQADVRSENHQLQSRLKSLVSLERMKEALEQKDLDLAAAQKEAREKTKLADEKLASVSKLEDENATLKTVVSDANHEVEQLKKDKENLTVEVEGLKTKASKLESHLEQLAAKLVPKLEGMYTQLDNSRRLGFAILSTHSLFVVVEQNSVRTSRLKPDGSRRAI